MTPVTRWLLATLARLPLTVESLSVMAVFSDFDDVPRVDPAIKANLRGADGLTTAWSSRGPNAYPASCDEGVAALEDLADTLRDALEGITFLLPVDEWQTEAR
jgi:hypothetical protein